MTTTSSDLEGWDAKGRFHKVHLGRSPEACYCIAVFDGPRDEASDIPHGFGSHKTRRDGETFGQ